MWRPVFAEIERKTRAIARGVAIPPDVSHEHPARGDESSRVCRLAAQRLIQDDGGVRAPSRGSVPQAVSAESEARVCACCVCVRAILTFFASISGK